MLMSLAAEPHSRSRAVAPGTSVIRTGAGARWRAVEWGALLCFIAAGALHWFLVGGRVLMVAPVDGESLLTWLVLIGVVLGLCLVWRMIAALVDHEQGIAAFVVGIVTLLLLPPIGIIVLFIHGPVECTVLQTPDGSRDWAACEYVSFRMESSYSLHRGNGFTFDKAAAVNIPGHSYESRGAFTGGRYSVEETSAGELVLRFPTEHGGPVDGRVSLPR